MKQNNAGKIIAFGAQLKIPDERILKDSFNCPICGALAHQIWIDGGNAIVGRAGNQFEAIRSFHVSKCFSCNKYSFWYLGEVIYPKNINGQEKPNKDLNDDIKEDYLEAAAILDISSRGIIAFVHSKNLYPSG